MTENQVKILDGNTFVVSDERGDIEASLTDPTGLFSFDTRFLSRWVLTVDGRAVSPPCRSTTCSTSRHAFPRAWNRHGLCRRQAVGDPPSHGGKRLPRGADDPQPRRQPAELTVRVDAGCDFADLFEVKDAVDKKGSYSTRLDDRRLVLTYRRETFSRSTVISSSQPCALDEHGLTFQLQLGPHGSWKTGLDVVPEVLGATEDGDTEPSLAWQARRPRTDMARNLAAGEDEAPRLECGLGAAEDNLPP